jgi:hypothetical protein
MLPKKATALRTADAMSVILEGTEEGTSKNDTEASSKNDIGANAADRLHIEEKRIIFLR